MMIRPLTHAEAATVPGMVEPQPDSLVVMGAVDEAGDVVAALGFFFVVHADPIWVRRDHRNGGKLLLKLWQEAREFIRRTRMGTDVVVGVTPTNPGPEVEGLVEKLCVAAGGSELAARFWSIPVE